MQISQLPESIRLSELMGAFSHALDLTEGQPPGHCVRCCWIGMHIGRVTGLDESTLWELYFTLLLKDLGCSSNAARICELYLTDDLEFKRNYKMVGDSLPRALSFVLKHTGLKAGLAERFRRIFSVLRDADTLTRELISTRCHRGAEIATKLRFPREVANGILSLDEHFNGKGRPQGLAGSEIPLHSRIALLAQVIDVFHTEGGPQAALEEARLRSGSWFDPELVRAFEAVAAKPDFWIGLATDDIDARVYDLEPQVRQVVLDNDFLDDIAAAFGQVVDAKSPYTSGHSTRVAQYADAISESLGIDAVSRRWLRRGALLHDVGKLGVSNSVLDKAGSLDEVEWEAVRRHAEYTESILGRFSGFAELARISAAHHERLDGAGYPRGLKAEAIMQETRIITTADIFDAITAERPYRSAIPLDQALDMMRKTVGTALDPACFDALCSCVGVGGSISTDTPSRA